jgi:hypothetical protein
LAHDTAVPRWVGNGRCAQQVRTTGWESTGDTLEDYVGRRGDCCPLLLSERSTRRHVVGQQEALQRQVVGSGRRALEGESAPKAVHRQACARGSRFTR